MGKYLIKRILIIIPVFLGITVLVYFMASLAPGSPIELLMSDPFATATDIEKKRQELGLDKPVVVQYLTWLGQLLRGNFGISYRTYGSVLDATDTLKDLWEDKPAINELELAKALIAQIVLLDDDLREQVLCRANVMAGECAAAVAPYLRVQS